MDKTYHYEIPAGKYEGVVSREFDTVEECVEDCRKACIELEIDYDRRDVKLFLTAASGISERNALTPLSRASSGNRSASREATASK